MPAERFPVLASVLRDRRRSLVGWAVALAAVSAMYVAFWPAMGDGAEMQALVDNMPEGLATALGYDAIGSAAGYLESTIFGLLGPALLLVFAIGTGARLVAGEEEDGTLELELAHPVGRLRVLGERLAALVLAIAGLSLAVFAVTLAVATGLEMDVTAVGIAAASTGMLLLAVTFGCIALGVGAATGRRALALAVAAGLAVLTYIADAVAPLVDWGGWLEVVSPFSWYLGGDPLVAGFDAGGLAALAALAAVATAAGMARFGRRDLLV
jgi:ABC-2 type transport system permease protein